MAGTVTFIGVGGTEVKVVDGTTITGWIGGSLAINTDIFLITSSLSDKTSAATVTSYGLGVGLVGEPWDFSSTGGDFGNHIFMIANIQGTADTLANGGFGIIVADDLATDSVGTWYVGPQLGSLGGWEYFVIDPSKAFDAVTAGTAVWTLGGNPAQLAGVDGIGVRWKVTNSIMGASDNTFIQTLSVGTGYRVTGTDSLFSDFSTYEQTNRYGALQTKSGVLLPLGQLRVGVASGAGNTSLTESGFTIIWQGQTRPDGTTKATAEGFYGLFLDKGSGTTNVTLSNGTLAAASPETFDLKFSGATGATITNLSVDRARVVTLDSAVSWIGGVVKNSGQIDASGAVFKEVQVLTSSVAADATALLWNVNTDTDGKLDDCTFSKGTNAHHAIQLGTSSPTTVTLRRIAFSGFNASNAQNDSTLLVSRTSGTVTINLVGCSGNISYKTAGATVTLVVDPVTTAVTVKDITTGSNIQGARVLLLASDGTGPMPYQKSTTITRSSQTATATCTGHGLLTNDYAVVKGANESEYNGVFQVTVTDANTYTYTVTGSPATPATGTITTTGAPLYGTTDSNGLVSASRSFTTSQPITGRVRKATTGTLYKTGAVSGVISNTAGFSATVQLIADQ